MDATDRNCLNSEFDGFVADSNDVVPITTATHFASHYLSAFVVQTMRTSTVDAMVRISCRRPNDLWNIVTLVAAPDYCYSFAVAFVAAAAPTDAFDYFLADKIDSVAMHFDMSLAIEDEALN